MKHEPMIFLFSAPSGTGKGTIVSSVLQEVDGLSRIVTATSRPKRPGEVEGQSYYFIPEREFRQLIRDGAFVEWNEIYGDLYGTKKDVVDGFAEEAREKGHDLLLEIDVDGKRNFVRHYRNVVSIFLLPPSLGELDRRIRNRRAEPPDQMKRRLRRAQMEMGRKGEYDYRVVNDSKDMAVGEVKTIIAVTDHIAILRAPPKILIKVFSRLSSASRSSWTTAFLIVFSINRLPALFARKAKNNIRIILTPFDIHQEIKFWIISSKFIFYFCRKFFLSLLLLFLPTPLCCN